MKRLFTTHFYFGRLASRTDHEFLDHEDEALTVQPTLSRWFCGMHDMESTYICQLL